MSRSALAIIGIAAVLSTGLWLSMRVASRTRMEMLPARCRRRIQWWQGNERIVQFGLCPRGYRRGLCPTRNFGQLGQIFSTSVQVYSVYLERTSFTALRRDSHVNANHHQK
jgi:hypothetical protein